MAKPSVPSFCPRENLAWQEFKTNSCAYLNIQRQCALTGRVDNQVSDIRGGIYECRWVY